MEVSGRRRLRQVDDAIKNQADEKRFYEEVYKHYGSIRRLINREIEKDINVITAIDSVLNNDMVSRLYPELRKSSVKRRIRAKLLTSYFNRETNKRNEQENSKSQGEER